MITKLYTENEDTKYQSTAFAWNFRAGKNSGQCFHASAFLPSFLGQTSYSQQKQPRAELAQGAVTHLVPFLQVLLQPAIPDSWNQQHHTLNPTRVVWKSSSSSTDCANERGCGPCAKPEGCFTAAQAVPPNASQLSLRGLLTPQHPTAVHRKSKRTAQEA